MADTATQSQKQIELKPYQVHKILDCLMLQSRAEDPISASVQHVAVSDSKPQLDLKSIITAFKAVLGARAKEIKPMQSTQQAGESLAVKVLYFFDGLLLSLPSFLFLTALRLFSPRSQDKAERYTRSVLGEYLSKKQSESLKRTLRQQDNVIAFDPSNPLHKAVAEGLDSYKTGWQLALHRFGLFTSVFYGLGTAVMVGFFVMQLALPLWVLIPLVSVLVAANFAINMTFAFGFTPKVFHWLLGQGALFEGLYHFENPDYDPAKCVSEDNRRWVRFNRQQRASMRIAFWISTASALAVSALTYVAMLGTLSAVPLFAPYAFVVSVVFAAVTTLFLATLFVNNWKEVVYRGPYKYFANLLPNLVSQLNRGYFNNNDEINPKEMWAMRVVFVVNIVLSVLGFTFLFMVCFGPMMTMLGPYVTFIGMAPGILAQMPNLFNFCADFAAKMVLKVSREVYPVSARELVGNSSILRGIVTPLLIVWYLTRSMIAASFVTVCFLPILLGFLAKYIIHHSSKVNASEGSTQNDKRYARVGSASVLSMTFLLLEVNSNALAYAAALPSFFIQTLVFSWVYTFFQRGIVFVPMEDSCAGKDVIELSFPNHVSMRHIGRWFTASWRGISEESQLPRSLSIALALCKTFAKALFMVVSAIPLAFLAGIEWVDRRNSDSRYSYLRQKYDNAPVSDVPTGSNVSRRHSEDRVDASLLNLTQDQASIMVKKS